MIILVFYEITETNLPLALGTFKAKKKKKTKNDVPGKGAFHVSKKAPVDVTITETKAKEKLLTGEKRSKMSTPLALLVILKVFLLFLLLCRDTVFSKQTIGTFYKLYLL